MTITKKQKKQNKLKQDLLSLIWENLCSASTDEASF